MVVLQLSLRIPGKRRMRLIAHPRLDMYLIHTVGDLFRRRSVRQLPVMFVQIAHRRHCTCRQRHQLIRTFQVMVLQRRRVNLRQKLILVFAIRLRRIQMLGAFGERGIKNRLALVRRRIGIIPQPAVTGGKQYSQQRSENDSHGTKFSGIAPTRHGQASSNMK